LQNLCIKSCQAAGHTSHHSQSQSISDGLPTAVEEEAATVKEGAEPAAEVVVKIAPEAEDQETAAAATEHRYSQRKNRRVSQPGSVNPSRGASELGRGNAIL